MSSRSWGALMVLLAIVIIVLAWFLLTTPAHAPVESPQATSTNETILPAPASTGSTTQAAPLDSQVTATTPAQNATVSHSFEIAGTAPNQWFFEAVFPIQVRDPNDDLIGTSRGKAQGDWTQPGLVTFTSQITVDASYEGPATLILLKDNPSGDPENSDEVTIPVTIQ